MGPRNTVISGRNSGERLTPLSLIWGGGVCGKETKRREDILYPPEWESGCGRMTILAGTRERRVGCSIDVVRSNGGATTSAHCDPDAERDENNWHYSLSPRGGEQA